LTLLAGRQEEHQACKNSVMRRWRGFICLERGANYLHMVQLAPLPPHHLLLASLKSRLSSCPGKEAVKRLFVLL